MKQLDVEKLYELAGDQLLPLEEKFHSFVHLLRGDFQFRQFFEDDQVPAKKKQALIARLYPEQSLFRQVIDFLVVNGLAKRVVSLADTLTRLTAARKKLIFVDIESAYPVSKDELAKVEQKIGSKVHFRPQINKSLIGGLKFITSDGRYFDGSLKRSLNDMRKELLCPTAMICPR